MRPAILGLRSVRVALVAASLVTLQSCAWWEEDVHIFSTAPKNKPTPLADLKPTLTVKVLWNASLGKADRGFFSPALLDTDVVLASGKGIVERRGLSTGAVVWKSDLDQTLSAGVGADAGTVAVAATNGELIALDRDGKKKWKIQTNAEVLSAPAVGQGLVIIRTTDNRVIAYDADNGKRRWLYQRSAQPLVLRANPGLVISGSLVYGGFPGGRLVAINVANGAMRWEASVAVPKGATELERVADIVGTPVITGREVCAAAFQGRAGCFDVTSGNPIWARDVSTSTGMEIDGRFVFITDDTSHVQAFSRTSGASIWKADTLAYRRVTAPASVGRAIVVGDYKGFVHWMSREDGSLIARSTTDGSPLLISPVEFSAGSTPAVLFQTQNGNVYAFATE